MTTTDYAEAHAALERQNRNADALAARHPIPPCPAWCALPAGHEWVSVGMDSLPDAVTLERHHLDSTTDTLLVQQDEQLHADGTVTVDAPFVYVHIDRDLDVEALRRLGARLMGAADRLACVRADVAAGL